MKSVWAKTATCCFVCLFISVAILAGEGTFKKRTTTFITPSATSSSVPGGGEAGPLQLSYWTPFTGNDEEPMKDLVAAFNRNQSEVYVTMTTYEWSTYYPRLEAVIQTDAAPNIAVVHTSKLAEFEGLLVDLAPYAEEAGVNWSTFSPSVLAATMFGDVRPAIPLDTHALVMYYNKELLRDLGMLQLHPMPGGPGIDEPRIVPGSSGFLDFLEEVKQEIELFSPPLNSDEVYPFVTGTVNPFVLWTWYSFYSQIAGGGSYLRDGRADFNTTQGRRAAEMLEELRDRGLWKMPTGDLESYEEFRSGKAAIAFSGVWATFLFEQTDGLDFDVLPIPTIFDEAATWGDSHTLVLPKETESREELLASIQFADWLAENGKDWAIAGHVPVKETVLDDPAYQAMPFRSQYSEIVETVNFYPHHPKLWACNDIMVESLVKMLEGEFTAEEAIEDAATRINLLLDASPLPPPPP